MQGMRQKTLREQMLGIHPPGDAWPSPAVAGCLADVLDLWPSHTMSRVWAEGVAYVSAGKAAEEFAKVGIVECMAFSSDGRFLGVSTADGALTIYDWHTGRPLNVLRSASASVQ